MTSVRVDIPVLHTERLILRAPRIEDTEGFAALFASDRSRYIGGPVRDRRAVARSLGEMAGLWILRGWSSFVAELKGGDGTPIGSFGPWYPETWPETEFGWTLWSDAFEGRGYVTEAMRRIIPWFWDRSGLETAISVIDEGNDRSVRVAEALGASLDAADTRRHNAPGGVFAGGDLRALIYRHRKEAWA